MLTLRNTRPSIARGSFEHSFAEGLVLGFRRKLANEETLVLINYGTASAQATVDELPAGTTLAPLYPRWLARPAATRGRAQVRLPPQSVAVFDLKAP